MKKELLAVLLAVAMAVPVFAAKGDMSVDAKLGLGLGSSVTCFSEDWNDGKIGSKFKIDMPFMLGAEFFYGLIDNLSVGVGVNYVFDTATKMYSDIKGGTTNIYLAAKPEAKIESDIFTSIYLIGQIGLSIGRCDIGGYKPSVDTGLYLGAGLGTTIKDVVLVELIVSSSNASFKYDIQSFDIQYNITSLNIGYKFAL